MSLIKLILVPEDELSNQQKQGVLELERQCFGDVNPKEGKALYACARELIKAKVQP